MQIMSKCLHKVFKAVVNELNNKLSTFGIISFRSVTLRYGTQEISRIHNITSICQKGLVESKFERYQTFNQYSDLSNG